MKAIVFATRAIVEEFREYEPFFAFYEHGIRDLLREAVLIHSMSSPFARSFHPKGLVEKVEADFGHAFDCHHDSLGDAAPVPLFDEANAQDNLRIIRYVAHSMEDAVDRLFRPHLPTRFFEIADDHQYDHTGQALRPQWIGSDLLVHVRLLS